MKTKLLFTVSLILLIAIFGIREHDKRIAELEQTIRDREKQIETLKEEKAELQVVVDEVDAAEAAIKAVNPDILPEESHALAIRQVAKAHKYGIPRELITYRDWSEADLRWLDLNRKGPCGEHSTAQVWRPTFRVLRPTGDYNDMDQVYDAGTQYLADCYRMAQKWKPNADKKEVYRLTLAFYNAGMSHKPDNALYKARVHVRRVDGILVKAERLGVV